MPRSSNEISRRCSSRASKVIFDLAELRFVDSSGLGAFLSSLRQLNATGGDLKLCGMTKPVRALFELVRMHKIFDICGTKDEAIRRSRSKKGRRTKEEG